MRKILLILFSIDCIACTPIKQSTIDTTLQSKVDSILQNKMSEINALSGQAIVMDIQKGEIKAMVVKKGTYYAKSKMRRLKL